MFCQNWFPGIFCSLIFVISLCCCNQMDPHVFPSEGPFFEGWYMRIMDQHAGTSVGWLFSRILADKSHLSEPQDYDPKATQSKSWHGSNSSSIIPYSINAILLINQNKTSKLATDIKYFPLKEYSITQDGHPITHNPDDRTPPHFVAKIGENVTFIVRPNGTKFSLNLGGTIIRGETDQPVPWGPHGEGPEGWIDKLPLPLHWFVYSLRSNVLQYEVIDKTRGILMNGGFKKGRPVIAHMEKNWGAAFPKAWIWAQGVDSINNVSFAISSGLVTKFDIPAQLSNYRNPGKGINCKFTPLNSEHVLDHDGCNGNAYLHVTGLFCEVVFEVYTKPEYLSDCLTTPQTYGYTLGCVESYNAIANVTVYQRHGLHHMVYADSHLFHMAALEFGGDYMCNGKCP